MSVICKLYTKTDVVEKFAIFCGPADLHYAVGDKQHLIVPRARVGLECTAYALE